MPQFALLKYYKSDNKVAKVIHFTSHLPETVLIKVRFFSGITPACAHVAPTLPDPVLTMPDLDGTQQNLSPLQKGRSMTFGNVN